MNINIRHVNTNYCSMTEVEEGIKVHADLMTGYFLYSKVREEAPCILQRKQNIAYLQRIQNYKMKFKIITFQQA